MNRKRLPESWTQENNNGSTFPTPGYLNNRHNHPSSFFESFPPARNNYRRMDDDNLDDNFLSGQDFELEDNVSRSKSENLHFPNRVHSIHKNTLQPPGKNLKQAYEARTGGLSARTYKKSKSIDMLDSIENHANKIVAKMEEDPLLMEDSPTSEELRKEALRDMPQCLTLKKCVRVKLSKSVSQKSKRKPLGCGKMFKYRMSIASSRFKSNLKNFAYTFQPWYSSIKYIEGNYGSGVASFFKFLRWIFLMNLVIAVFTIGFIILPQVTYQGTENSLRNNTQFNFIDIFTGEGYLTNTFLYYGYYSNHSVSNSDFLSYSMPDAYFFTFVALYLSSLIVVSVSAASSYRKSFIETEGGLKNVFAQKIFCGWDYRIATEDAAKLKSHSIFLELKELLFESLREKNKDSLLVIFWTRIIQLTVNVLVIASLIGVGYLMTFFMKQATQENWPSVFTPIVVNVVMTSFPLLFSLIVKYEGYKNPKVGLYLTLLRTFVLGFTVIGVLVNFWLQYPDNICWETSLGQEIYRLMVFDFIFSIILMPVFNFVVFGMSRLCCKESQQSFDIAHNTMEIIYNQALFWMGFFFSPFLTVLVVLKMVFLWYAKEITLKLCKPSSKTWRATQATTWFLIMALLSLLIVGGLFGYIIADMETSNCGPFGNYQYIYEIITVGLLQLEKGNKVWNVLLFVTKPGFIALVLIALCGRVYYLRAKAHAQRGIVTIYREMLMWEARDKEFLIQNLSNITKGRWKYSVQDSRQADPLISASENFIEAEVNQIDVTAAPRSSFMESGLRTRSPHKVMY